MKIGGTEWKIRNIEMADGGEGLWEQNVRNINASLPKDRRESALWHEIKHVVNELSGGLVYLKETEEDYVRVTENMEWQLLKEAGFFEWAKKKTKSVQK